MRNENHFSYSGEAIAREKKTNLQAFTMMSGETQTPVTILPPALAAVQS